MKILTSIVLLCIFSPTIFAKGSIESQADRLHQYAGHWVSSNNANTDNVSKFPAIKMNNISTMNNQSMQVEVGGVKPVDYFKKYPNRFLSWHIKDYKELGASGKIDWMELFHHQEFEVPKYMVAEVKDYSYPCIAYN